MIQELTFTVQELLTMGGLLTVFILALILFGCIIGRSAAPGRLIQGSTAGSERPMSSVSMYEEDPFHLAMNEKVDNFDERIETIGQRG
jgi:hypothetical protein